jgi:peptidoglycan/xylan/chitin deacetylase (PgdA/CDA1 family)
MVLSRFKALKLDIPGGKVKGVVLSFDVETWDNKCGGRVDSSADPEDEYFRYLPGLLDLLKDYSIKAHFFVCGKVLDLYPEAFRIVLEKGHAIGGHGYAHEKLYSLSGEEQKTIVEKVRSLLNERFAQNLKSWRSPELASNRDTDRVLNECGVKFCSNAPWGRPFLLEGVVEIPLVRKMDNEILGYSGDKTRSPSKRWADYMKSKFEGVGEGVLVFGMHTWVQKKFDPKYEALTSFLNFLESKRSEVWFGSLDDLKLTKNTKFPD